LINDMDTDDHHIARRIKINGIVQGVGFRPFIFGVADQYQLKGEVANTSDGVIIHIEGARGNINLFIKSLSGNPPPLAYITDICVYQEKPKDSTPLPS
jgi:hydrogenase maturation protein HypF